MAKPRRNSIKCDSKPGCFFSNGEWAITVQNIGQLISELNRIPKDMPLKQNSGNGVDLVIFNRTQESRYVSFDEAGNWYRAESPD